MLTGTVLKLLCKLVINCILTKSIDLILTVGFKYQVKRHIIFEYIPHNLTTHQDF